MVTIIILCSYVIEAKVLSSYSSNDISEMITYHEEGNFVDGKIWQMQHINIFGVIQTSTWSYCNL